MLMRVLVKILICYLSVHLGLSGKIWGNLAQTDITSNFGRDFGVRFSKEKLGHGVFWERA